MGGGHGRWMAVHDVLRNTRIGGLQMPECRNTENSDFFVSFFLSGSFGSEPLALSPSVAVVTIALARTWKPLPATNGRQMPRLYVVGPRQLTID